MLDVFMKVQSGQTVPTICGSNSGEHSKQKEKKDFLNNSSSHFFFFFSLRELGQPGERHGHIGFHLRRQLNYQDVRHQGHPGRVQQPVKVKQTRRNKQSLFSGICRYIC